MPQNVDFGNRRERTLGLGQGDLYRTSWYLIAQISAFFAFCFRIDAVDASNSLGTLQKCLTQETPVMIKNIERQTYDDALTDLLTVQEAATRLRLSARFVYRLCSNGELPHFRFGSSIRIDPIELEQYKQESVAAVRKRREERPIASKNRLSILKKRK